ncbi:MAG TPA: CBS domain-containing protein [Polyangiaceae bacterium]|jgi:CBS domain-containing protein
MEPLEIVLRRKGADVYEVGARATVLDAVEEMCRARVGAVLVMDEGELVGIFSERDLMTRVVLMRKDPASTPVGEVMTRNVVTIGPDVTPREAMALVTLRRVRHLPVVVGRRVVGLVSIGDLVRWTIEERKTEVAQLQDYVMGRYPG